MQTDTDPCFVYASRSGKEITFMFDNDEGVTIIAGNEDIAKRLLDAVNMSTLRAKTKLIIQTDCGDSVVCHTCLTSGDVILEHTATHHICDRCGKK